MKHLLSLCLLVACQTVSTSSTTNELASLDAGSSPPDPDAGDGSAGAPTCLADDLGPPPFDGCDDDGDDAASCSTQRRPPPGYSQMTREQQCFQEPGFSYTSAWYEGVASDGWCEACGGSPTGSAWSWWNTTGDKVCQGTGVALTSTDQKCVCTTLQATQAGLHLPAVIATAYMMNHIRLSLLRGAAFRPMLAIEIALQKAIKGFGLSVLKCQELASALCADYAPGALKKHCLEVTYAICNTCRTQ
jgi:hypothetical protein